MTRRYRRHLTGRLCERGGCGAELADTIVYFGEKVAEADLTAARAHAAEADVALFMGSSLKVRSHDTGVYTETRERGATRGARCWTNDDYYTCSICKIVRECRTPHPGPTALQVHLGAAERRRAQDVRHRQPTANAKGARYMGIM